jgi:uncharacterized membrane protein
MLLGAALLLRVLAFHLPQLITHLHDPNIWTVFGEMLALAAGAWMLAAWMFAASMLGSAPPPTTAAIPTALNRPLAAGRYLFAAPLVIFGVLHFIYAFFISTFIPAWIPQRFFFANFVGLCFIAAALAIATGVRARLAGYLLAAMFLIWVAIVHAPRVAVAQHNGNEWTSMFVALAMAGCALAVTASAKRRASPTLPK